MKGRLKIGLQNVRVAHYRDYFRISQKNKFAEKCLLPLQRQQGSALAFDAFLLFAINACASNDTALKNFAFSVYSGGKGSMTKDDVMAVCLDAYNLKNEHRTSVVQNSKEWKRARLEKKIEKACSPTGPDGALRMDYYGFLAFTKQNSLFLFPAFKLQQAIRSRVRCPILVCCQNKRCRASVAAYKRRRAKRRNRRRWTHVIISLYLYILFTAADFIM